MTVAAPNSTLSRYVSASFVVVCSASPGAAGAIVSTAKLPEIEAALTFPATSFAVAVNEFPGPCDSFDMLSDVSV